MATFTATHTNPGLTAGAGISLFTLSLARLTAWNDARITRKSLSRLSARELDDIGLSFSDIDAVANGGLRR